MRTALTNGVAAYQAVTPSDSNVFLIDLGAEGQRGLTGFASANEQSLDGIHPNTLRSAQLAAKLTDAIQIALDSQSVASSPTAAASGIYESVQTETEPEMLALFTTHLPNMPLAASVVESVHTPDHKCVRSYHEEHCEAVHQNCVTNGVPAFWLKAA